MMKNYFFEISEENYFNHTFTTIIKFKSLNVMKIILDSQVGIIENFYSSDFVLYI